MKIVFSTLESNKFSGILIKKGNNPVNKSTYKQLKADKTFCEAVENKYIFVIDDSEKTPKTEPLKTVKNTVDFATMPYQDLVKYAKENNIDAPSKRKSDILQAIKDNM